ncbi:NAD(P)-dependent oxidoreductase [Mycobacterium paraterrae]|uniref:SDR family oxidoreductase n=1 Tax=Mycobacterium paraterrae TaxID=577492 RepID=A0ABY3VKZ5_9MYCO|nr:NAD(P)-binding oxidoreductase [Mycobacterium paraterrae]UMB70093.1 SDR family oxidoreductase [Mycobacterium paraterrae]
MKLVILGATGGVGQHLVTTATGRGDEVLVVARDKSSLPGNWACPVAEIDLSKATASSVESALAGVDAVLSALGARGAADHGILEAAATTVLAAMRDTGVRRYIGVSAAPVATTPSPGRPAPPRHDPGDDLLTRSVMMPIVKRVFAAVYADSALMEDAVRASDRDWTIMRPARLTNKRPTGQYRTAVDQNVRGGRSIGRTDLAHYMLDSVNDTNTFAHSIGIAY